VFATRCSRADRALVIYVAPNDLVWSRLGLSVGKRVGNAVRRNYIKRRLREAFRTQKSELPKGLDIICVARPEVTDERGNLARSLHVLVLRAARDLARRGSAPP
jgi:ribonuclease P protein component